MSTAATSDKSSLWLDRTAIAWVAVALAGQALFAVYIFGLYGYGALAGDWTRWNRIMPNGLIGGDGAGNASLVIHMACAAIVTISGGLQLLPAIRQAAPAFHRWNGRVFIVAAIVASLAGLYITWSRNHFGGLPGQIAISGNAAVIFLCAAFAWRAVLARDFARHERWAVRLFLVVSGVWFLRVFLMTWALSTGGAGMNRSFTGPADIGLQFASWVVPVVVYEIWRRARVAKSTGFRAAAAGLMSLGILVTLAGSALAAAFMWLPRL